MKEIIKERENTAKKIYEIVEKLELGKFYEYLLDELYYDFRELDFEVNLRYSQYMGKDDTADISHYIVNRCQDVSIVFTDRVDSGHYLQACAVLHFEKEGIYSKEDKVILVGCHARNEYEKQNLLEEIRAEYPNLIEGYSKAD